MSLSLRLHLHSSLSWQDGAPPAAAQPVAAVPVIVAAAFAKASPLNVPRFRVTAAPARIVPTNCESVMVTASATHQKTLLQGGGVPAFVTTLKLVPVSAP